MFSLNSQAAARFPSNNGAGRGWALLTVAVAVVAVGGCGSSASNSQTTASSAAAPRSGTSTSATTSSAARSRSGTSTTGPTSAPAQAGGTASVTTGPVRGTLHATNHTPIVNKNWPYSVVVADAAGHPLSGTVDVEFTFGGQVVGHDTPPTHPLENGRWSDNLQFPAAAVGEPLTFQVVVHTHLGSITLDWPVTVKQ